MAFCQKCKHDNTPGTATCEMCNAPLTNRQASLSETLIGTHRFDFDPRQPSESKVSSADNANSDQLSKTRVGWHGRTLEVDISESQELNEPAATLETSGAQTLSDGPRSLLVESPQPRIDAVQRAEPVRVAPSARIPEFQSLIPHSLLPPGGLRKKHLIHLLVGVVISASLGALLALFLRDVPVLTVSEFSIDTKGNDRLTLQCRECLDGSHVRLHGASATFLGGKAVLYPTERLKVGRNDLQFTVDGSDGRPLEAKPVVLPVAFRLLTSWKFTQGHVPIAEISVEAPPESSVQIGKDKVALKAQKAVKAIRFPNQSFGQSAVIVPLRVKLPVIVTLGTNRQEAEATLDRGLCPLTFKVTKTGSAVSKQLITGRSAPGARITIGELVLKADKKGLFSHEFSRLIAKELKIVARTDELLPRRALLKPI